MTARRSLPLVRFLLLAVFTGCAPARVSLPALPTPVPGPTVLASPPTPAPPLRPGLCPVTPRAPGEPLAIAWSDHRFASAFWIVDRLSGWDGDGRNAYARWWSEHYPSDAGAAQLLHDYAALRSARANEVESPPDMRHPDDVLPPDPTAADRFAATALCSQGPREAALALGLTAEETLAFVKVFDKLGGHIDEVLDRATYLEAARARLQFLATRADMGGFLAQAARFYGSSARVESPLYVDVVWAPPGNTSATTMVDHMIVPISSKVAGIDEELQGWLGVVVHEFGHYFAGRLPAEQKAAVSDRIVGTGGLLRSRHSNIVDEATAAALGNMIFLKARLPAGYKDDGIYNYEVREQYPDAIESLARAVEPHLARLLDKEGAFSGDYLNAVLAEQQRIFPPRLDHFAAVALLFSTSRSARHRFTGLFFGRSRWESDDVADFAKSSDEGRDQAGLRQTLIAISRGMTVPGSRPSCVR